MHQWPIVISSIVVQDRVITGKFFWGGKVIFPDIFFSWREMLFAGRKFPFWLTKNKFQWLLKLKSKQTNKQTNKQIKQNKNKTKQKKPKNKTKEGPHFVTFLLTFSIFHLPFFNFPSFFLASPFPVRSAEISRSEVSDGHSPSPAPPCYYWFKTGKAWTSRPGNGRLWCITVKMLF